MVDYVDKPKEAVTQGMVGGPLAGKSVGVPRRVRRVRVCCCERTSEESGTESRRKEEKFNSDETN